MEYKNNLVNLLFGNNFQKKTYQLVYKTNSKKFIYDGKKPKLHKEKIRKNLTSDDPLSSCIKVFLSNKKKHFKKNFNNALHSMSILFTIKELYKTKYNFRF